MRVIFIILYQLKKKFPTPNFLYYFSDSENFLQRQTFYVTFPIHKIFSNPNFFILLFRLRKFSVLIFRLKKFFILRFFPILKSFSDIKFYVCLFKIFSSQNFFNISFPTSIIFFSIKFCICLLQLTKFFQQKFFYITFLTQKIFSNAKLFMLLFQFTIFSLKPNFLYCFSNFQNFLQHLAMTNQHQRAIQSYFSHLVECAMGNVDSSGDSLRVSYSSSSCDTSSETIDPSASAIVQDTPLA